MFVSLSRYFLLKLFGRIRISKMFKILNFQVDLIVFSRCLEGHLEKNSTDPVSATLSKFPKLANDIYELLSFTNFHISNSEISD